MIICENCLVRIHYRLTGENGQELDSSLEKEPLTYLQGSQSLIPGLQQALLGKAPGDRLLVTVNPEEGYGLFDPKLVKKIPHDIFKDLGPLEAGMCFEAKKPNGETKFISIQDVGEAFVTVNENHPLAGRVLNFEVTVEDVSLPTGEVGSSNFVQANAV